MHLHIRQNFLILNQRLNKEKRWRSEREHNVIIHTAVIFPATDRRTDLQSSLSSVPSCLPVIIVLCPRPPPVLSPLCQPSSLSSDYFTRIPQRKNINVERKKSKSHMIKSWSHVRLLWTSNLQERKTGSVGLLYSSRLKTVLSLGNSLGSHRTSSGFSWTGVLVLRRRGRSVVKQDEAVRAMRLRPTFRQWTSEVTGTSEKRARSRDSRAKPPPPPPTSLLSMSLTMFRISWRSACRVIPRMFKMADTCFFLHTEEESRGGVTPQAFPEDQSHSRTGSMTGSIT